MLKDTYLNKVLRYRGIPCRGGIFGVIGVFVGLVVLLLLFAGVLLALMTAVSSIASGDQSGWEVIATSIGGFLFGYYVTGFLYRKVISFFGKSVR